MGSMTNTNKTTKTTPGFAIELKPDTELSLAMLIAEDEEGRIEPVAVASTINEAKELAESDLRSRMRRLERDEDPGICPVRYRLWARGIDGDYIVAHEINATTMKPATGWKRITVEPDIARALQRLAITGLQSH